MKPKLKEGEEICDSCRGTGKVLSSNVASPCNECPKCHGTGKLDWIEKVTGKRKPSTVDQFFEMLDDLYGSEIKELSDNTYSVTLPKAARKVNLNGFKSNK